MTIKLRVDLAQGILEVEGDEGFVRDIFSDFREHLQAASPTTRPKLPDTSSIDQSVEDLLPIEQGATKPSKRGRTRVASRKNTENANGRTKIWIPKIDNSVPTDELRDFVKQYALKGHAERILVYGKYLQSVNLYPFSADQIFTCYMVLKDKLPTAIKQAFHDAKNKAKFIDFQTPDRIEIGIVGTNHFNHGLAKAGNNE